MVLISYGMCSKSHHGKTGSPHSFDQGFIGRITVKITWRGTGHGSEIKPRSSLST